MVQLNNIKALLPILKKHGYNSVSLFDTAGKCIMPYNNNKKTAIKRFDELLNRWDSPAFEDGTYIIRAKLSYSKNVEPDEFVVIKGTAMSEGNEQKQIIIRDPIKSQENNNNISLSEALKLTKEHAETLARCNYLEKENENLKQQLDEQDDDADELQENKPENNLLSSIKEIITTATPYLDRLLDIQEKKIMSEKRFLPENNNKNNTAVDEFFQNYNNLSEEEKTNFVEAFKKLTELSEQKIAIINNFNTGKLKYNNLYNDFLQRLKNEN